MSKLPGTRNQFQFFGWAIVINCRAIGNRYINRPVSYMKSSVLLCSPINSLIHNVLSKFVFGNGQDRSYLSCPCCCSSSCSKSPWRSCCSEACCELQRRQSLPGTWTTWVSRDWSYSVPLYCFSRSCCSSPWTLGLSNPFLKGIFHQFHLCLTNYQR